MKKYPVDCGRNRHSIRLKNYDYSSNGAYFITLCSANRECVFGNIVDEKMNLNDTGKIVAEEWIKSASIRDEVELDEWVIMPNHFHAIIVIALDPKLQPDVVKENSKFLQAGPKSRSVGALLAGFKSAATRRNNELLKMPGEKLWQRNYWERIIRNDLELHKFREYIRNNPAQWELDSLYSGI